MTATFQGNQIAAGHNNAAGLTNIETLADANNRRFVPVNDLAKFRLGEDTLRGDGIVVQNGDMSFTWVSGILYYEQWYYLYNTLLSGTTSGLVTVRTRKFLAGTYNNYNATLNIGQQPELGGKLGYFEDFVWRFTRVTAI